jgi:hypothetical protein
MDGKATTSGRIPRTPRRRVPLRTRVARNLITAAVWATYLALGVVTAGTYGYLDIDGAAPAPLASAFLAVLGWPAVFLGASLHV